MLTHLRILTFATRLLRVQRQCTRHAYAGGSVRGMRVLGLGHAYAGGRVRGMRMGHAYGACVC